MAPRAADESDRLYRLPAVFRRAVDLFGGNVAAAPGWFTRPCRGRDGATPLEMTRTGVGAPGRGGLCPRDSATPLEMTRTGVGAREVENLIGRLEHGVFT